MTGRMPAEYDVRDADLCSLSGNETLTRCMGQVASCLGRLSART